MLPVIRFLGRHVLTVRTPIGRKVRPRFIAMAAPLIRVKSKDLAAAGVERVPRVVGVRDGLPLLADGRVLDVANVVWCTGFRYDFSWIDLPVLADDGQPLHERGVVPSAPGLYFVGLVFQYAAASDVLPGVGRDAAHVVRHLRLRRPKEQRGRAQRGRRVRARLRWPLRCRGPARYRVAASTSTGASTTSFSTEYQSVSMPAGVPGSSGERRTKSRSSDGLTAKTASESR